MSAPIEQRAYRFSHEPQRTAESETQGVRKTQGVHNKWPEQLSPEAFHGLAGELVRQIEPQTEADEAAVLLQILVSFGALVGRGLLTSIQN
jgi:hypothetical protein